MIYIITTKTDPEFYISEEYVECITSAIGKRNVTFVDVERSTLLDFIKEEDIVICQTRNRDVLDAICKTGCRNTVESNFTILYTQNKEAAKILLRKDSIPHPKTITKETHSFPCFVKPYNGENSKGVTEASICENAEEQEMQEALIKEQGFTPITEEYIDGKEVTVALYKDRDGEIKAYGIELKTQAKGGILTPEIKDKEEVSFIPYRDEALESIAKKAFKTVGCKHYMRIDFRIGKDGTPYLIDFNLFPGLLDVCYFAMCLKLCAGKTYKETLDIITSTATKKHSYG